MFGGEVVTTNSTGQRQDTPTQPTRGDLKESDYKTSPKNELSQNPIDESKNPALMNPTSIMS
jgi:hypothetical protein